MSFINNDGRHISVAPKDFGILDTEQDEHKGMSSNI